MQSSIAYTQASTTSSFHFEALENQLHDLHFQLRMSEIRHSQIHTIPSSIDQLEHFRIRLYLSLIPRDLVPSHLFTVDPSTGTLSLNRATDGTIQFLDRLETLWQVADFDEDLVLECIVCAVSGRQSNLGGEYELTIRDLECARRMVEREV